MDLPQAQQAICYRRITRRTGKFYLFRSREYSHCPAYDPASCGAVPFHYTLPYEALSYVWGSGELCHTIVCDGKALKITRNLYRALHFFRRKRRSRALWVDAICINQSNMAEKEIQIPLMRDIYTQASKVLMVRRSPQLGSDHLLHAANDLSCGTSHWCFEESHDTHGNGAAFRQRH